MITTNEEPPSARLHQLILGYMVSQGLYVCAKLGLADMMVDGSKSCAQLAEATGAQAVAIYRVLRALASVGVFAEEPDGSFRLTPTAECLRSDVAGSLRAYAILHGSPEVSGILTGFLHGVQTGQTPFEHAYGMPVFRYIQEHPNLGAMFQAAMGERTRMTDRAILDAYDFSGIGTVIDVGGGRGAILAGILRAYPTAHGILLDLPDVVARSEPFFATEETRARCAVVGGDFFESVPAGGDVYVLKSIIHDWDDEHARAILQNCRTAMADGGRLLLIETVIPPGNEPFLGKIHDLLMLAIGGRERTRAEYSGLLGSAGLELERIIGTQSPVSIIEAVPA